MKPLILFAIVVLLSGLSCGGNTATNAPIKKYPMRGQVQKLDSAARIATIRHDKIGDWMDAMTMDFPVRDAAEFAKLHTGDKLTATVYVQDTDFWIGGIQVEQAAKPQQP